MNDPCLGAALPSILTKNHLHEVERQTTEEEAETVGDEEGASSILITNVWEPPDITKTHSNTQRGEKIFEMTVPLTTTLRHHCFSIVRNYLIIDCASFMMD